MRILKKRNNKMCLIKFVVFCLIFNLVFCEDLSLISSEYLHSAINDLKEERNSDYFVPGAVDNHNIYELLRMTTTTEEPEIERVDHHFDHINKYQYNQVYQGHNNLVQPNKVPSLSLTKGELLALYDSALQNGNLLNSDTNTAVHELPESYNHISTNVNPTTESVNGYYYYYYPLKTLLEDINNSTNTYGNPAQYGEQHQNMMHSHTHLHNIKIQTPPYGVLPSQPPKNKALEPLFMAISSFMGMAMMFLFSMVFLPQFRSPKSRSGVKEDNLKSATISEIVFEAIEGHDCRERIYCEAGKMLKTLNLSDNRFLRFFQRIMPNKFSRSIDRIRQEAQKKRKCVLIQCKRKGSNNNNLKNNNSIHLKMQPKNVPQQQKNKNNQNRQKINNNNNNGKLKNQKKT